ncbi:BRO-N domain-containing protein [Clostridium botulinum]
MSKELKELQIGFSDEFSYNNHPIKYEITKDNKLQLYVEDCAFALGVTDTKKLKDGTLSTTIRWNRVYDDLIGIEKIANSGDFKKLNKDVKMQIRKEMKQMTITETQLYLWSFRVDSEQGKKFRDWLATVVLPNLREYGIYVTGMENMTPDEIKRTTDERVEAYILRKFGIGIRKELTDTIKKILNPSPYEGYIYATYTNIVYRVLFGMNCKEYKQIRGLIDKDNLRDDMKEKGEGKLLDLIAKAEDFMGNLIMSGITDETMLENLINNWYMRIV